MNWVKIIIIIVVALSLAGIAYAVSAAFSKVCPAGKVYDAQIKGCRDDCLGKSYCYLSNSCGPCPCSEGTLPCGDTCINSKQECVSNIIDSNKVCYPNQICYGLVITEGVNVITYIKDSANPVLVVPESIQNKDIKVKGQLTDPGITINLRDGGPYKTTVKSLDAKGNFVLDSVLPASILSGDVISIVLDDQKICCGENKSCDSKTNTCIDSCKDGESLCGDGKCCTADQRCFIDGCCDKINIRKNLNGQDVCCSKTERQCSNNLCCDDGYECKNNKCVSVCGTSSFCEQGKEVCVGGICEPKGDCVWGPVTYTPESIGDNPICVGDEGEQVWCKGKDLAAGEANFNRQVAITELSKGTCSLNQCQIKANELGIKSTDLKFVDSRDGKTCVGNFDCDAILKECPSEGVLPTGIKLDSVCSTGNKLTGRICPTNTCVNGGICTNYSCDTLGQCNADVNGNINFKSDCKCVASEIKVQDYLGNYVGKIPTNSKMSNYCMPDGGFVGKSTKVFDSPQKRWVDHNDSDFIGTAKENARTNRGRWFRSLDITPTDNNFPTTCCSHDDQNRPSVGIGSDFSPLGKETAAYLQCKPEGAGGIDFGVSGGDTFTCPISGTTDEDCNLIFWPGCEGNATRAMPTCTSNVKSPLSQ